MQGNEKYRKIGGEHINQLQEGEFVFGFMSYKTSSIKGQKGFEFSEIKIPKKVPKKIQKKLKTVMSSQNAKAIIITFNPAESYLKSLKICKTFEFENNDKSSADIAKDLEKMENSYLASRENSLMIRNSFDLDSDRSGNFFNLDTKITENKGIINTLISKYKTDHKIDFPVLNELTAESSLVIQKMIFKHDLKVLKCLEKISEDSTINELKYEIEFVKLPLN